MTVRLGLEVVQGTDYVITGHAFTLSLTRASPPVVQTRRAHYLNPRELSRNPEGLRMDPPPSKRKRGLGRPRLGGTYSLSEERSADHGETVTHPRDVRNENSWKQLPRWMAVGSRGTYVLFLDLVTRVLTWKQRVHHDTDDSNLKVQWPAMLEQ